MLASYRTANTVGGSVKSTIIGKPVDTHNKHKEHSKNVPILPEVGQYVIDAKAGRKYLRGRIMGKVRILFFL